MEEILQHLGCIEPCKGWDKLPTSTGAGFLPSTVAQKMMAWRKQLIGYLLIIWWVFGIHMKCHGSFSSLMKVSLDFLG